MRLVPRRMRPALQHVPQLNVCARGSTMELAQGSPLAGLPLCLLEHVLSYLTLTELNVAAVVSRRWLGIAALEAARPSRRTEQTCASQFIHGGVGWLRMLEPSSADACEALAVACDAGNLPAAKWIVDTRPPSSGWHCRSIRLAAKQGRLEVLRWLKRVYVSTPQETSKVHNELAWMVSCDRKVHRWLSEQLDLRDAHAREMARWRDTAAGHTHVSELARWHVDHCGDHWDIDFEIRWGDADVARWLVEQFGTPDNPDILNMGTVLCYAKNLQVTIESYSPAPAAMSQVVWQALTPSDHSESESYRWRERRYGPPTDAIHMARWSRTHQSARWIAERADAAAPTTHHWLEQTRRYQADTYGLS